MYRSDIGNYPEYEHVFIKILYNSSTKHLGIMYLIKIHQLTTTLKKTLMQKKTITIINKLGLHARAASKLVATASSFESNILIGKDEKLIDGKSIMAVLMLAATKGTIIEIIADGEDENEALQAIYNLINRRFDEEE